MAMCGTLNAALIIRRRYIRVNSRIPNRWLMRDARVTPCEDGRSRAFREKYR